MALFVISWVAAATTLGAAQHPAYLVKDINHGAAPDASSSPSNFVRLGRLTLFTADDGIHGCELWRTDGTAAGTEIVADLRPGPEGSCSNNMATYFSPLASDGHTVFLRADTGAGDEFWTSDGTTAGTLRVKQFGKSHHLDSLTLTEGKVFFTVLNGVEGGYGLWHSDGTEAGTVLLRSFDVPLGTLAAVAGQLFFVKTANNYPYPAELWTSDGTDAGTLCLPNPGSVAVGWLAPLSRGLLYAAADQSQLALWISDGTVAGTRFVAPLSDGLQPIAVIDDALYFTVPAQNAGTELWKSDGTPQGTSAVGLLAGIDPSAMYSPTVADQSIFFLTGYGTYELWKTDTVASPPTFLRALPPDLPFAGGPALFRGAANRVFLVARTAGFGAELWTSDGTPDGTVQVKDINPGTGSSAIGANGLANDGVLFFAASDGTHGSELWRSDGTPAGTWLVKDINVGASSAKPEDLTAVGDTLFFTAFDPTHGRELWSSDGTESGTTLARDLYPGPGGAFDLDVLLSGRLSPQLRNADGRLFFVAESPGLNAELWSRDPVSGELMLAADIAPGPFSSNPSEVTVAGDHVFFIASWPDDHVRLWTATGQPSGTGRFEDVIPYSIGSSADSVFVSGITLLPGGAGATKPRLWKLSATALTPTLLGEFDNPPMDVTGVDGGAFFWVREPYCSYPGFCAPVEIWKTDGTAAGTVRVGNVGSTCPSVSNYFLLHNPTDGGNGRFYFTLYDPFSGDELYVSDGTAAGTHMVADINPGADPQFECPSPHSSSPHELTLVGNLLYFAASEPDHGTELWRTDGTATGTVLVKDINPGPNGSSPSSLANVNGILLFSADDGVHGSELWVSDGTEAGTQLFTDIAAGAQSSSPAEMTVAGSRVFLVANDGEHGRELWAVPLAALPPTLTPTPASFTPVSTGTPTPTPGPSPCVGDCNGDEQVTVDEILTLVNMALGNGGTCGQGAVVGDVPDITFIVQAVNNALDGCVPVTAAHVQHTRPPMRVIPD